MHADLVGNCTVRSAQETARSVMNINMLLHLELPETHIVSLAILPKGETWPNRCSEAILTVNAELQVWLLCNSAYFAFSPQMPRSLCGVCQSVHGR